METLNLGDAVEYLRDIYSFTVHNNANKTKVLFKRSMNDNHPNNGVWFAERVSTVDPAIKESKLIDIKRAALILHSCRSHATIVTRAEYES